MTSASPAAEPAAHSRGRAGDLATPAAMLQAAENAYAADADHLARSLLISLVFDRSVPFADIAGAIERGLARYGIRARSARTYFSPA